jgi:hypothetical protein
MIKSPLDQWRSAALVALATFAVGLFPLAVNPRFYFVDDYQLFFMPLFGEIARLIKSGTWPLMTEHSWFGGAVLGNYECAIFNPVSLALYLFIDAAFSDLSRAAAFFSLSHLAILAVGCFFLLLELGCRRGEAAVGALTASTSTWTLYWSATGWVSALVSLSWLPFAFLFLARAASERRAIVPAALLSGLVLVSGWPIGNVALFVIGGSVGLAAAVIERSPVRAARVAVALALGLCLALPAILPTWYLLENGVRILSRAADDQWQAPLKGLLTFGFPSFLAVWKGWDFQYRFLPSPPMFYAGWFLPLVLVNARWRALLAGGDWRGWSLAFLAVAFLLLAMSPTLGQLRWSFRWIPEFHLVLVLLTFWVIAGERRLDRTSEASPLIASSVGVTLFVFVLAVQNSSTLWLRHSLFLLAVLALIALWQAFPAHRERTQLTIFAGGHVAILAAIIVVWPGNGAVRDWGMPASKSFYAAHAERAPIRQLFLFSPAVGPESRDPAWWQEIMPGNTGLLDGKAMTLNGYSSMYPAGLTRMLCLDYKSAACPDAARRLFTRDYRTGLTVADLLGLDRVVVARHTAHETEFERWKTEEWRRVSLSAYAAVYERRRHAAPAAAAGVAWAAPGVTAQAIADSAGDRGERAEDAVRRALVARLGGSPRRLPAAVAPGIRRQAERAIASGRDLPRHPACGSAARRRERNARARILAGRAQWRALGGHGGALRAGRSWLGRAAASLRLFAPAGCRGGAAGIGRLTRSAPASSARPSRCPSTSQ